MSNEIGKPDLFFDSKLQHYLDKHHVTGVFVSFSHEGDLLSSYALAERDRVV
jgi:phosphopantetheinyl transferase (holo-ACP synthase)